MLKRVFPVRLIAHDLVVKDIGQAISEGVVRDGIASFEGLQSPPGDASIAVLCRSRADTIQVSGFPLISLGFLSLCQHLKGE